MITRKQLLISLAINCLITYMPSSYAQELTQNNTITTVQEQPKSYGKKVGEKALNGITNIATGFLEIPKNVINISNAQNSNVFFGMTGGAAKGMLDMLGRVGAGVADVITAPLPTKPIAQPQYIWQDFDVNTTYDDVFRLQNQDNTNK